MEWYNYEMLFFFQRSNICKIKRIKKKIIELDKK